MKKIIAVSLFACVALLADGKAIYDGNCAACHGGDGKTKALDKSAVIAGIGASAAESAIRGYKAGTLSKYGEGATMKSSVEALGDADIKAVSAYIGALK